MDETTFQVWNKPAKTWMPREKSVDAPLNNQFLSSVTLYGAVGGCLIAPQYMMSNATDIPGVKKFLIQIAGALRNPYSGMKPYLVMDNH